MRERNAPISSAQQFIIDRRGRARIRTQPRGHGAVWTAAVAACTLAVAPMTGPGEALVAAARHAARSAADMIAARSPGLRSAAYLIKTKGPRVARPHRVARALPRVRPAPPRPAVALLTPPPPPVPIVLTGGDFLPAYPAFLAAPAPFAETPCPCGFGFAPGYGFGGGGGFVIGVGGGGGGVVPPPVQPPAVPEPPDWAMMILGFTLIGWAWRRRRVLVRAVRQLPQLFYVPVPRLIHVRRD